MRTLVILTLAPKTWLFLVLSGLATGASWVCYFRALKVGESAREWTGIPMVGAVVLILGLKRA